MNQQSHIRKLILASSSPYRKLLLQRLQLDFSVSSPNLDETPGDNESAVALTRRLAREKSRVIAAQFPSAVVIGSDQVALFGDRIIGKPGSEERAIEQLSQFSGGCVQFHTAVHVHCIESGFEDASLITTEVNFRHLAEDEIRRYVKLDQVLDCAGGFKSEEAGITLLDSMISSDPTAIIGLPLITLATILRRAGFVLP